MNANVFVTKDYENETTFRPQKNKTNANTFSQKDYEYENTTSDSGKTNPIKPNFKRALFSAKTGNFFTKKLRKCGEGRDNVEGKGISLIWRSS